MGLCSQHAVPCNLRPVVFSYRFGVMSCATNNIHTDTQSVVGTCKHTRHLGQPAPQPGEHVTAHALPTFSAAAWPCPTAPVPAAAQPWQLQATPRPRLLLLPQCLTSMRPRHPAALNAVVGCCRCCCCPLLLLTVGPALLGPAEHSRPPQLETSKPSNCLAVLVFKPSHEQTHSRAQHNNGHTNAPASPARSGT